MSEMTDYGILNTQVDPRFSERRFGRFGTIAKNGCGMIALYNVERAANPKTRFDEFYVQRKPIKTNLFGLLGTRPSTIPKNLRKKGYSVNKIRIRDAGAAKAYDAVIVLYWRFFGAHYVAGIKAPNGGYTFYNEFVQPCTMTLAAFVAYLKKRKLHPFRIWGIGFPQTEPHESKKDA